MLVLSDLVLQEGLSQAVLRVERRFATVKEHLSGPSPLVSRFVNKCSIADAAFDLVGRFAPAEGLSVFVPVGEEASDGLLQARDALEAAAADGLAGNQGEPAFDQV